jgi:LysM repeat protein
VSIVLITAVALTASMTSRQWTGYQEAVKEQLVQIETGISELAGKVLDTASSLAVVEVEAPTSTPTPVVVLAQLSELPARAGTVQPDIVLAPTTVPSAVGGANIAAVAAEPLVAEEEQVSPTTEPATPTPIATEEPTPVPPTATPTPTEPPPTSTPTLPPTPTAVPATPTPQPVAAAAAATGGGGLTHTVQAGDNWFSIARRYGITQDALAAYNNRRPTDILQVGQALRIPPVGAAVAQPAATSTPVRPTPTTAPPSQPAPSPTVDIPPVVRLSAPVLLTPISRDGFSGAAQPVLTWSPVVGFGPQDFYYVLVRFTMRDGQQGYVEGRVTTPSFTMPMWVYDVASPPERLSAWSVQVRRQGPGSQEIEISPPSELRAFYWR